MYVCLFIYVTSLNLLLICVNIQFFYGPFGWTEKWITQETLFPTLSMQTWMENDRQSELTLSS